jgi:hypothetical protein
MDQDESSCPIRAYFLGVLLSYGVCVIVAGKAFATRLPEVVELGLIAGLCPMIILGPAHFLFQRYTYPIISEFFYPVTMRRWGVLLINLPALLVGLFLLLSMGRAPSAASRVAVFKELTGQVPPASVEVLGYNIQKGMGEGSCAIPIRISELDLGNLITNMGLSEIGNESSKMTSKEFRSLAAKAGVPVFQFESPITIYGMSVKKGVTTSDKRLIVGTNSNEVLLLDSFY